MVLSRPGNTRQLANEMRRLAALAETGAIMMPEHLLAGNRRVPAHDSRLGSRPPPDRSRRPAQSADGRGRPASAGPTVVQYTLKKCDGRFEETAEMLGLSRKGLYLERQRFGIEPPQGAAPSDDGQPVA